MKYTAEVFKKVGEFQANNKKGGSPYTIKHIELTDVFYTKLMHEVKSATSDTRVIVELETIKFWLDNDFIKKDTDGNKQDICIIVQGGIF